MYHITTDTIIEGDSRVELRNLPPDFFQSCVTSPPYWGLRDYDSSGQIGAEDQLEDYVSALVQVFVEVKRVLRSDGTLWLNIGDGYTSGDRGWRAPDKKNPARAMSYRPPTPDGLKPKDLLGIPWRLAFALQMDGWYLRSDIIWNKPNAQPESVKDRPARSHEYLFLLSKSERYFYDHEALKEPTRDGDGVRNRRSVWAVPTEPNSLGHAAMFPPGLIEPCILGSTRKGDWVIDPFFGAGTVGMVAKEFGRHYTGIELKSEFVDIARRRLTGIQTHLHAI
jgi:DNA modification methylase